MNPAENATSMGTDPKPQAPRMPEPWECCQGGCDPCIYDRYWQELEVYERALRQWETGHALPAGSGRDPAD